MTKIFDKSDYKECDALGKKYAIEVAKYHGWDCQNADEKESFRKSDLIFTKGDRINVIEVEVRADPNNNFDKIGNPWDTLDIPSRKGEVAKEKDQLADLFMTFRKDGKYFWQARMKYVLKFKPTSKTCRRNGIEWEETSHRVKIDWNNVDKFEVIRNNDGIIIDIRRCHETM